MFDSGINVLCYSVVVPVQRRSKGLVLLSDFESQQVRGIGNYEQKNPEK